MQIKNTYKITGMTCNGCRILVQKILSNINGLITVSVSLEKAEATIEMNQHIPLDKTGLSKDNTP